jgi:hypothetical protein
MKNTFANRLVAATVCASLIATPAMAANASSLIDINGSNASSAQNMLEQQGFKYIDGHKGSYGANNSYWWNSRDKNCVVVEVMNGIVVTVNDAKTSDCGHSSDNDKTAAVVGLGALLVGAILASKSHHRDNKNYSDQETLEFDRGYKDGLYNASYHNYSRSSAYSDGYQAGVAERNANLDHHLDRGGYEEAASYADLKNARAAGAMDDLASRGFRQVDNFATGTTRYSIQYRKRSRQCLQVTIADGRVYDISDIQQHPNCR